MSALLDNAVLSIQLGLQDFAAADERRLISSARNLYAGVLLICKEVLRQLSPPGSNDLLIRVQHEAVRSPGGIVRLVGAGKKTIDRLEIEQAFKQLQLQVNLTGLKRLSEIRNDIEHMHATHAPALIREALADAMPIIRDVIVKEMHEEPSALLGVDAWNALLNEARVFNEEQAACRASFNGINWASGTLVDALEQFQCPKCSSTLLRNDNSAATKPEQLVLVCCKCGEAAEADDVIEAALQESLSADAYVAAKDGGEAPLEECPECGRESYVIHEAKCQTPGCGFSLEGYECAVCSEGLTLDDYRYGDGSLCSYHANVVSKDD